MHQQLLLHDRDGLTVAMHATRGGSTVVLALILAEIEDLKVSLQVAYSVWFAVMRVLLLSSYTFGEAAMPRFSLPSGRNFSVVRCTCTYLFEVDANRQR